MSYEIKHEGEKVNIVSDKLTAIGVSMEQAWKLLQIIEGDEVVHYAENKKYTFDKAV